MGSAAEWAALREERDSLVHLLVEMRRAAERTHPSKMLRVGGGYEQLPDYLAKLTAPLPPELRMAIAPYEVSEITPAAAVADAVRETNEAIGAPMRATRAASRGLSQGSSLCGCATTSMR